MPFTVAFNVAVPVTLLTNWATAWPETVCAVGVMSPMSVEKSTRVPSTAGLPAASNTVATTCVEVTPSAGREVESADRVTEAGGPTM